jgi:septin family protein
MSNRKEGTSLRINVMDTAKSKIPQRAVSKNGTLPRFPFSFMLSGSSGSGKTNFLLNLLTRKELYGGYFHYIVVYSPTAGKYDDSYKALGLPDENFIEDFGPEQLNNLIDARKKLIDEKGIEWVGKHSRVCIILDDIIANRAFLDTLNCPERLG